MSRRATEAEADAVFDLRAGCQSSVISLRLHLLVKRRHVDLLLGGELLGPELHELRATTFARRSASHCGRSARGDLEVAGQ